MTEYPAVPPQWLKRLESLLVRAPSVEGPGGLYHKLNVLRRNGRGGWCRIGPTHHMADGSFWQFLVRQAPDQGPHKDVAADGGRPIAAASAEDLASPVPWERLRVAAGALAPPGAAEAYCERCQAFQGHVTEAGLLLGGAWVRLPATLNCRRCGHEWHDRGPGRGR